MRILIVTNYPFPLGMAQTNRILAMAKGLSAAGAEVELVVSKATERGTIRNINAAGTYQGVKYTYTTGTTIRPSGTVKRAWLFYRGMIGMYSHIVRENRKKKIDAIFMGVYSNRVSFIVYLIIRMLRIGYIQERSEFPFLSYSNRLTGRIKLGLYLKFICARFDGFIVISKALQNHFKPYLKKGVSPFLLPILVETERFSGDKSCEGSVITYCGSMEGSKDGVPILIEAFSRISGKFPDAVLRLIGSTDFEGFNHLQKRIDELNLANRIVFTGRVERDEMPELLQESRILALARPASKQAEGGFPTKLGEYLATGKLVVVTAVGDIPDYLEHGINALLAEPGSVTDFAEQLAYGLSDEKRASEIALEGRKLADDIFNHKVQGERLFNWLKSVVSQ